jgi:hypothetical protein
VYEFPEDGTDIPEHVGAGEDHAFTSVCNLYYKFINTEGFRFSQLTKIRLQCSTFEEGITFLLRCCKTYTL